MLEMENEGAQSYTNGLCLAQEMAIFVLTVGDKLSKSGGWTSLGPTVDGQLTATSPVDGNAAFQVSYRPGYKDVII